VRAGDYVFTSSIYPIDKAGHAIETDILLGEAGPSLIAAQTRHCLEALKTILKEHGSSLDRVLKAEVHLSTPRISTSSARLARVFSGRSHPPARPLRWGTRFHFEAHASISTVALAGDSKPGAAGPSRPRRSDPIEAEAAPGVRAGNLVFCSGFTASNFSTDWRQAGGPDFQTTANDAVAQAEYFFNTLNRVCAGWHSLEQALESYL
jgi:enamine deaminase RidA (YjgF/YER057c/UK114 family)